MLQIEENKRQRSLQLIQLIYERQFDCEISFQIRKLLEEGVLIDFQDQNRNKKTAIHLAIDKRDVTCVKYLLQFKPNLRVKDGNGKTPVEIAESKGNQNILNALLHSTVNVVDESYVEVIDYESLTPLKIEAIKSKPTFKVLKLTNCPSINDVWNKLSNHGYTTTMNESSHLFFIAIETKETSIQNDHELMMKVLNLRRPMIVQLISSTSQITKIYFKDDLKDFVEITDTPLTREEFNEAVQSEDDCNMKLLVAALRSNLFGRFTGDLLDTKLKSSETRGETANQFVRSNALCHRFFKLFDENQPQIDRIVAALSFKGDQSSLALLDLPFELKEEKLKLSERQQDILSVVDARGYNLLMIAAELGNLDAIKLLVRCCCDFNHSDSYDKRASDICLEVKAFDCLAELIESGSPYPSNFCISEVDESSAAQERINKMTEVINSFHDHIKEVKVKEVNKFIASHPHIKHAYDTNNKCALTVALESSQVDLYSLLLSEGFEPGADDEYRSACSESKFKKEITNSHRKYFKEAFNEPHLKRLLKMFRLSFGSKDQAKCSTIIRKMFDKLNKIENVIPILQICSLSDKLRIVFDFNCNSVADMDPTAVSNALGAVYPISGFVYIGAKNHKKEFCKVIGTLIHELTHYAMKLTYDNNCKPYDVGDIANAKRFEAITKETKKTCDGNPSTDSIITTVFTLYKPEVWHQELIVRVPQLFAHYKKDKRNFMVAARNINDLFHFYRDETLTDVERQSKVLLNKYLIRKINNQTGITRKIENMNVKFEKVEIDLKPSVNVITSNAPQLTLAMLHQNDRDNSHIFVSLEQVAIGNILDKIAKVKVKESSTALIADCIGLTQKYQESLRKLLKDIQNIKTIALVMNEAESLKAKENFPEVEFKTFDHKWVDLTERSKAHLLDQNVIFQGVEMKLNELVEPSSEAMNFFPLGELVDCKDFRVGHELQQTSHKFFVARKFIKEGQTIVVEQGRRKAIRVMEIAKSFEELLQYDSRLCSMIISDEAGSGKSLALLEFAKSMHDAQPNRWVLFVDLKRHIEAFKSIEDYEVFESFEDFILQQILKNATKVDQEIFKQMFRDGKTFILFDGFDEVCPNYKDLLLHVLKLFKFKPRSGNRLFITTRPHLVADLEGALGGLVFKLEELSKEDQRSFLRKYLQPSASTSHKYFDDHLLDRFHEWFSLILTSKLIGLPLLMRMTAEIFDDPIKNNLMYSAESLNITSVFRKFVEKYFLRWTKNENEISLNETVEFVMAGGVLEVHHQIAMRHLFGDEFKGFHIDESDAEKISRVGIIRYDEKSFQFIHETFAEYFAADFIWFHLNRKNRDPSYECHKTVELLFEVLYGSFKFGVIKTFLDQTFEATNFNPSDEFCKSLAKDLSEVAKSKNRFDFLRKSLNASQKYLKSIARLLLQIVKHCEEDVLLKMLQSKTSEEETVLLCVAAHESVAIVSKLCNIVTTCTAKPKEIYQEKCLLLRAAQNTNEGVLTTLFVNLDSVRSLTKKEKKFMIQQSYSRGRNIITIAAGCSTDNVFLELLSLLPNYLSPAEVKRLLLAVDKRKENFFHRALSSDTNERLKTKFDVIQSKFDDEAQKISFYKPATAPNMFHFAAQNRNEKIFETIIESTLYVLSNDEVKSMLMQKDSEGSNVLHVVAKLGNETGLKDLNLLLRERLYADEIKSLLLQANKNGQNCFHLAANNHRINLQCFCETIGNLISLDDQTRLLQQSIHQIDVIRLACGRFNSQEIVPVERIKPLLTVENRCRLNAFQMVARDGDVDKWNELISFAKARFSDDEMKSVLFCFDTHDQNYLHLAVSCYAHANMIEAIFETIKNVSSIEDRKRFVRQKHSGEKNVFHSAANHDNISKWYALSAGMSTILSQDEMKEMLKEKDSNGDSILLCYLRKPHYSDKTLYDLITFLQTLLTSDEMKEHFLDVNCEGKNFFQFTVERSPKFEIESLSNAIKKILNEDEQRSFFEINNPNVFRLALNNLNSGTFSTLYECLKGVLTMNEIKALIQEKDFRNKNILHSICHERYFYIKNRLRDLLKVLKCVCSVEEIKNFMTSSDNKGRNCLHLAAQFSVPIFLDELFIFIQTELSIDEQRELILKCDKKGNNIFTCASRNKVQEANFIVENFARGILSGDQIKELKHKNWFVNCLLKNVIFI